MNSPALTARARRLVALALLGGLALLGPRPAAADAASDYSRSPEIRSARLSPSGHRLALLVAGQDGADRLAVMDLDARRDIRGVAGFARARIVDMAWVNDERLVYQAVDFSDGVELPSNGAGVFAVNHNGSDPRPLIAWRHGNNSTGTRIVSRVLNWEWGLDEPVGDGSADVWVRGVVVDATGERTHTTYARLDTRDGQLRHSS